MIGRDAPWLMPNPNGTFEEFIVSSWVEATCDCAAMLLRADLDSLYALVFHPEGLPEYQLRAVACDLICAGATLGDPDLRAAGRLASSVIAGAARKNSGSGQRQFDPPSDWDGKARLLLIALLRTGKGRA